MSQPKRKKGPLNLAQPGQTKSENFSDFHEQCLRNSVVLRTIFKELPASDLLSCRLVNKSWFTEVNSVMVTSDIALEVSSDQPFEQVRQLIQLIPKMSLPFNGLSFRKGRCQMTECEVENPTGYLVRKFLKVLPPIKHLYFDQSSASDKLMVEIIRANADHLESLSFDNSSRLPINILVEICQLDKLKKIIPKNSSTSNESCANVLLMTKMCKSLQVVPGFVFDDLCGVTENQFKLVKNLNLSIYSEYLAREKFLKFIEAKPRLKSVTSMLKPSGPPLPISSILSALVHSAKETLTSVDFSPYVWGLLARGLLHFEPFPCIRELHKVPVNFNRLTSGQVCNFGKFVAKTFPNLKSIQVENLDFEEEDAVGRYDDVFAKWNGNGTLESSSVTSLKFVECLPLQVSLSAVILVAFPNLTNLNVSLLEGKLQSVYDLWGEGLDLKSLTVSAQVKSRLEMESELLGIFPEEARRLRELKLSPAQLRSLQIVPIRPTLHHLSALAELSIRIRLRRSGILLLQWNGEKAKSASDFDHNEIIKALSLARMKGLKITS